MEYLVTWTIDIDADSPEEAAQLAHQTMLNPDSIATVFRVEERHEKGVVHLVDLTDDICVRL